MMTCLFSSFSECDEEGQSWILQLRNCGPRQIGKYRALAKSKAGTDSKEWQVQLVPPPKKNIVSEQPNSRPSIHEEQQLYESKVSPIFRHPSVCMSLGCEKNGALSN